MTLSPADFTVPGVYLDNAGRHPLPIAAGQAIAAYAAFLTQHPAGQGLDAKRETVRAAFAQLIGAEAGEIALVPGTGWAETIVLHALGWPRDGGRIVTDALHFSGSLERYRVRHREGADVVIVPLADGQIDYDRLAEAITPATRLVAISSVSHWNGFQHDLQAVCALAHDRGALVYADIIQHVGALPFDAHASGVDFAACGSYKWLLGDMGLGFLYVRRDRLSLLQRPEGPASGLECGTLGASAVEALLHTLPALASGGVAAMQTARAAALTAIDRRFSHLPLLALTPPGSLSPIRAFATRDGSPIFAAPLAQAGIRITVRAPYFRLSPSVFNTVADIDVVADLIEATLSTTR